jgi:hypothetical protein
LLFSEAPVVDAERLLVVVNSQHEPRLVLGAELFQVVQLNKVHRASSRTKLRLGLAFRAPDRVHLRVLLVSVAHRYLNNVDGEAISSDRQYLHKTIANTGNIVWIAGRLNVAVDAIRDHVRTRIRLEALQGGLNAQNEKQLGQSIAFERTLPGKQTNSISSKSACWSRQSSSWTLGTKIVHCSREPHLS